MFQFLWVMTMFGCPKDRTGLSQTNDLYTKMEEIDSLLLKMNEVERRITKIEHVTRARGQSEIMKLESVDQVRMEMANIRGEMERIQFQLDSVQSSSNAVQSDSQFRLDWLEERASSLETALGVSMVPPPQNGKTEPSTESKSDLPNPGQTEAVSPSDAPSNIESTPVEDATEVQAVDAKSLLDLAKNHLVGGREEAAEAILNRILKEFPKDPLEPEVRYRLAEAAFNNKEYAESARRFQDVLNRFPNSPFASWSLLRQGECFEAMGQPENAKIFYRDVISEYPKTKAAKEAETHLNAK